MAITIVRKTKGIVAPVLSPNYVIPMYISGGNQTVSRKIVSTTLNIHPESVNNLGLPVASGGRKCGRTWYYIKDFISALENLEEGLSAIWLKECLIGPEAVAKYLGVSMAGLRMMRYRSKGPPHISITPQLIRYSKSSVDSYELRESTTLTILNKSGATE